MFPSSDAMNRCCCAKKTVISYSAALSIFSSSLQGYCILSYYYFYRRPFSHVNFIHTLKELVLTRYCFFAPTVSTVIYRNLWSRRCIKIIDKKGNPGEQELNIYSIITRIVEDAISGDFCERFQ